MSDNSYALIKYIAGGIGMLLFIGLIAWCHLEETRMKHDKKCPPCPPCEVQK